MKMSFSLRQISETLGKNRGFSGASFESEIADRGFRPPDGQQYIPAPIVQPTRAIPSVTVPVSVTHDSRGAPLSEDMNNIWGKHMFPTMLSKAPRTSNGQDFKAQQNIETIAEVLWSFGSRYLLWNWKVVSHYELFGKS